MLQDGYSNAVEIALSYAVYDEPGWEPYDSGIEMIWDAEAEYLNGDVLGAESLLEEAFALGDSRVTEQRVLPAIESVFSVDGPSSRGD